MHFSVLRMQYKCIATCNGVQLHCMLLCGYYCTVSPPPPHFPLPAGSLMIFPFLPFMVHDFFPELSREELGNLDQMQVFPT